eukprot:2174070-Rhodomonas_salina.2
MTESTVAERVGIGVVLGLNELGGVVVEDVARGWPAAFSSLLAKGDSLIAGITPCLNLCSFV